MQTCSDTIGALRASYSSQCSRMPTPAMLHSESSKNSLGITDLSTVDATSHKGGKLVIDKILSRGIISWSLARTLFTDPRLRTSIA